MEVLTQTLSCQLADWVCGQRGILTFISSRSPGTLLNLKTTKFAKRSLKSISIQKRGTVNETACFTLMLLSRVVSGRRFSNSSLKESFLLNLRGKTSVSQNKACKQVVMCT